MVGKKILLLLFAILTISCENRYVINAKMICVEDSKPCTDSLYEIEGRRYNGRTLDFTYLIKNEMNEKLFIPINTRYRNTVLSHIKVYFIDNNDTIVPDYEIKKVPYNSEIINPNDSMWIIIHIFRIPDWQRGSITVNTNIHDIVRKLNIEYCEDSKDDTTLLKRPKLIFEKVDKEVKYYELPRGGNFYPL